MQLSNTAIRARRAFACALFSLAVAACDTPENRAEQKKLDTAFDQLVENGFSGYAIVAKGGEIIFSRGAGDANAKTGAPFAVDTQVDTASITKSFTGMIAADMIARGELKSDATLSQFFPDTPTAYANITVHQLLTHSGGLADIVAEDEEDVEWRTVRERAFTTALIGEPGGEYAYSNLGFSFVAAIIEQVKGASYDAVLRSYLAKAGIGATGYMSAYDPERGVVFEDGQTLVDTVWGGHAPGWALIGNGGVLTTPQDMIDWLLAYRDGRIIPDEAVALSRTPYIAEDPSGASYYGYGVVVEDHSRLGRFYWHNGGSDRFSARWQDLADQDVVIFVAANQWTVNADDALIGLLSAMFAKQE